MPKNASIEYLYPYDTELRGLARRDSKYFCLASISFNLLMYNSLQFTTPVGGNLFQCQMKLSLIKYIMQNR